MFDWLTQNKELLAWMAVVSVASLVVVAVALPILVLRLPDDYFARDPIHRPRWPRTVWNIVWHVAKNLLGVVFVLVGIVLLLLPGQGLLSIVIGILLLDFPGKYRLERWMIRQRGVLNMLNRLRARYGKDPLRM